jgi:hypothetical protein
MKSKLQFLNPLSGRVNNSAGMLINTIEHFLPWGVTVINLQYLLIFIYEVPIRKVPNDLILDPCMLKIQNSRN